LGDDVYDNVRQTDTSSYTPPRTLERRMRECFRSRKRPFRNSVDTITPRTLPTHPPNIATSERSDSLTHSPPIDVKLSASARRRSGVCQARKECVYGSSGVSNIRMLLFSQAHTSLPSRQRLCTRLLTLKCMVLPGTFARHREVAMGIIFPRKPRLV
jgi:hypothetical protein